MKTQCPRQGRHESRKMGANPITIMPLIVVAAMIAGPAEPAPMTTRLYSKDRGRVHRISSSTAPTQRFGDKYRFQKRIGAHGCEAVIRIYSDRGAKRLRCRMQIRPFHRQVSLPACNLFAMPSEQERTAKKVSVTRCSDIC